MTPEIKHIFNHSSCLTAHEIEQYVSGTLNEKEIRRVELHLADCPMCSDEIDGYTLLKDKNSLPIIISELHKQADKKISETKIIPIQSSRKKINKRIFSIAASFILLLGAGFIINFYMNNVGKDLAEIPAVDQALKEDSGIRETGNKKEQDRNVSEKNIESSKNEKESVNDDNSSRTETEEFDNNNAVSGSIINDETVKGNQKVTDENIREEEIDTENETIDLINTDVSSDKKSSAIKNHINLNSLSKEKAVSNDKSSVSKYRKSETVSSESVQPAEDISFMTTRGGNHNNKTVDTKEFEKYKSMRESGMLSYEMKIYEEALKDFSDYLRYKPTDFEIRYKYGFSYYKLKKYSKAIAQFDKLINESINTYVDDAEWYKAKSLIKLGKNTDAKVVLNKIIVKNGKYQNQALDLLNSLE